MWRKNSWFDFLTLWPDFIFHLLALWWLSNCRTSWNHWMDPKAKQYIPLSQHKCIWVLYLGFPVIHGFSFVLAFLLHTFVIMNWLVMCSSRVSQISQNRQNNTLSPQGLCHNIDPNIMWSFVVFHNLNISFYINSDWQIQSHDQMLISGWQQ